MSERPTFTDRWESVAVVHDASKADEMFDVYLEDVGHPVCGHTDCLTVQGMAAACKEADPTPWQSADLCAINKALRHVQGSARVRMLTSKLLSKALHKVATDDALIVLLDGGARDSVRGGGNQLTTYAMVARLTLIPDVIGVTIRRMSAYPTGSDPHLIADVVWHYCDDYWTLTDRTKPERILLRGWSLDVREETVNISVDNWRSR